MMDSIFEALEAEPGLMVLSSTVLHSTPRSPGGSSPSHLPAAQESAVCVICPASSSLASFGSFNVKFQLLADSIAALASLFSSPFFPHSILAAVALVKL